MADWQILLIFSIIILTGAGVSFIFHINTPEGKRSKGIIHPFSFILLVAVAVILLSGISYIFSKL